MTDRTAIQKQEQAQIVEQVVIGGDLSSLSAEQRVTYYNQVCESLKLNPYTKPFDYISLNGKLTLYARKDAADQLRKRDTISIGEPKIQFEDDWIIVTIMAHTQDGRTDSDVGVVGRKDMQGNFGNALMKAVTKAKRRVTLSICGLGWLDETEVETISSAHTVTVDTETGEIAAPAHKSAQRPQNQPTAQPVDKCQQFAAYVSKLHAENDKKCNKPMYEYLVGLIDGITRQDSHKPILSKLTGSEISSDNVPNWDAARYLLDILVPENTDKETGDSAPNEKYSEAAVNCIRQMWDAIMEERGQQKLIEEPTE